MLAARVGAPDKVGMRRRHIKSDLSETLGHAFPRRNHLRANLAQPILATHRGGRRGKVA